ncbi:TIGR02569 family protein [Corynebacterium alimapuense]|uniref:TIGR02569 family protein n=1 Tax=Corynebacterium alimapuense TaxID=1576874 RepID=A0A3M8K841_9CORY|nr:TIGR02569 family protein [Corynebacterium alimapuense]RNE49039.1 TIGR02569 family protein [Corynebacterium alimapuense]
MTESEVVPGHVIAAFQGEAGIPEPAGHAWDNGWRVGSVIYSRSGGVSTGWSAKLRTGLKVEGVRIARPVRSTDGRFVVAGWKASSRIVGDLSRRVDETVGVALRLADALASQPAPPDPEAADPFILADRRTWEETAPEYREIKAPVQVGHADLLASTIYHGAQVPAVTDVVPFAEPRPHGYTAALVMVDGLIAGAVDIGIVDRFRHIPDIDQLLLRAVSYRRHVNDLHPEATSHGRSHIRRVEDLLMSRLADRL